MRLPLICAAVLIAAAPASLCADHFRGVHVGVGGGRVDVRVNSPYCFAPPVYGYGGRGVYVQRPLGRGIAGLVESAIHGPRRIVSVEVAPPAYSYGPAVIYGPTVITPSAPYIPAPPRDFPGGNAGGVNPEPAAPAVLGDTAPAPEAPAAGFTPRVPPMPGGATPPSDDNPPAAGASIERAQRLIAQGDTLFAKQQFHVAAQRYKSAIAAAPGVGAAHFRRAIALIATNRYDLAAPAAKQGALVDPGFVQSSFRLDQMYKSSRLAKESHLDALSAYANAVYNSDNLFLVGMFLHFDGQSTRAQTLLQRAAQLESGDRRHLSPFLSAPARR